MNGITETEMKSMTQEQNYMRGYRDGKSDVLDKLRDEIEQITDTIHHGVSFYRYVSAIDVLQIIDKYKAETENP